MTVDKIGKYQILEKLGQGGMGVVYRALDTLIERVVAIKLVSSNLDDNPELRARFFREGKCAGQLSHKNIVTIFDLGEDAGRAYIAMEFLEGRDLRSEISKGRLIDLRDKIRVMREVCEGLEHAHERNVIHRDIKPANIFITKSGLVKILDFGLARTLASDLTTSGKALGTPNYMAPEQIRGEKADHRADIFSVGVVFYELLVRKKAFQGDSFTSTIYKILQDDPEPIEQADATIPAELCAIVYKTLAKDRDQRYQSLRELLQDLEDYCRSPHFGLVPEADLPRSLASGGTEAESDPRMAATHIMVSTVTPKSAVTTTRDHATGSSVPPTGAASGNRVLKGSPVSNLREEQTQAKAIADPERRGMLRRRALIGAIALIGVAGLAAVLALYRSGRTVESSNAPVSVSISAPPSQSPSKASAQPADQSRQSSTEGQSQPAASSSSESQPPVSSASQSQPTPTLVEKRAQKPEPPPDRPARRNPEPARSQPDQSARDGADQARAQLSGLKAKAEEAHASEFAPRSLEAATTAESEANRLYGQGKFMEAAVRAGEAAGLYRSAEGEARAERSRRTEQERQNDLLRTRSEASRQEYERERDLAMQAGATARSGDQFSEAEKSAQNARAKFDAGDVEGAARDYESAATAMRRVHSLAVQAGRKEVSSPAEPPNGIPAPTPAAAQPATDASDSLEGARKAVAAVSGQYQAAMEGKNLALLKNIWPSLSTQQEQAYLKQWAYTRSLRITPQHTNIDKLEGDSAIVTVRLHYEQEINDGTDRKWDQQVTFNLARRGRSWVIESARFQATR